MNPNTSGSNRRRKSIYVVVATLLSVLFLAIGLASLATVNLSCGIENTEDCSTVSHMHDVNLQYLLTVLVTLVLVFGTIYFAKSAYRQQRSSSWFMLRILLAVAILAVFGFMLLANGK